jgi:hypothetical protein
VSNASDLEPDGAALAVDAFWLATDEHPLGGRAKARTMCSMPVAARRSPRHTAEIGGPPCCVGSQRANLSDGGFLGGGDQYVSAQTRLWDRFC